MTATLGLERPVEFTGVGLFDPTVANMVLQAQNNYVNALRQDYQQGIQDFKEFNKEFGLFESPILEDNDIYADLTTGGIARMFNEADRQGIDLLRSAEGRNLIQRYIATRPYGDLAKLRQSAEQAKLFNKAKLELQAKGLYNPLLEPYDGPSMSSYNTLRDGIWDRMSPTPYHNMAAFTKDYFDNIKPFSRSVSKNGVSYTKKEITEQDLHNIADAHFNDLVNTPQGQLMYKMYLDQAGGDKTAARQAFNDAIVAGNRDRLYYEDDYNDNWYKQQNLNISRMRLNIAQQAARARQAGKATASSGSGSGTTNQKGQFDYQDFLIGTTAANVLGKTSVGPRIGVGGVSDYTPEKVSGFMGAAQKELAEGTYNYNFQTPTKSPLGLGKSFNMTDYLWDKQRSNMLEKSGGLIDIGSRYGKTFNMGAIDMSAADLDVANKSFLSQISVPSSPEHFAQWTQRKSDTDNSDYVLMNLGADKGRIYSADEIALTSAGVNRPKDVPAAIEKTKQLRKNLEQRFIDGKTMMKSEGFVLGRVGNDGAHHVFQKIRIVNKNKYKNANNSDLQEFNYNNLYNEGEVIYYDMGADTQGNPNYSNDFMENMNPVVTDQSLGSDRNVLKSLGLSSTNVKSDNSVPYLDYSSDDYDDDLLDLMGY